MNFTFHRRPTQILFLVIGLIPEGFLSLQKSLPDTATEILLHSHGIAFRELQELIQWNHQVILPR